MCLSSEKIRSYSVCIHVSSLVSKAICFLCFGATYSHEISKYGAWYIFIEKVAMNSLVMSNCKVLFLTLMELQGEMFCLSFWTSKPNFWFNYSDSQILCSSEYVGTEWKRNTAAGLITVVLWNLLVVELQRVALEHTYLPGQCTHSRVMGLVSQLHVWLY